MSGAIPALSTVERGDPRICLPSPPVLSLIFDGKRKKAEEKLWYAFRKRSHGPSQREECHSAEMSVIILREQRHCSHIRRQKYLKTSLPCLTFPRQLSGHWRWHTYSWLAEVSITFLLHKCTINCKVKDMPVFLLLFFLLDLSWLLLML